MQKTFHSVVFGGTGGRIVVAGWRRTGGRIAMLEDRTEERNGTGF